MRMRKLVVLIFIASFYRGASSEKISFRGECRMGRCFRFFSFRGDLVLANGWL